LQAYLTLQNLERLLGHGACPRLSGELPGAVMVLRTETTSMGETPLDHKQIVTARKVKKITSHFHVFFFRSDAGWKSSLSQPPHHINLRGDPPLRQLVILVASLQVCPSKAETARKGPNKTQQKLL